MKTFLLILSVLFFSTIHAQNTGFTGKWLLVKEQSNSGIKTPYYMSCFKNSHVWEVQGMPIGYWETDKPGRLLTLKSNYFTGMVGTYVVEKISSDSLITLRDSVKRYYVKLKQNEINTSNKMVNIDGSWKVTQGTNGVTLKFSSPDNLTVITSKKGKTTSKQSHWIYDSQNNAIIIYGMSNLMRGKHRIKELSDSKLILENYDKTLVLVKE